MTTKIHKKEGRNLTPKTPSNPEPYSLANHTSDETLTTLRREIEEIRVMRDILKRAYLEIYPSGLLETEDDLLILERDHAKEQRDLYFYALECAKS